jgi:gas vesicle protein
MEEIMSDSNGSNYTRGFIAGAIIGGFAGAVAALLLAPKSGNELRRDIADTSVDIYTKAQDYFKTVEGQVSNVVNEGKAKAQGIMESARNKAEELLADAESVLKDARVKAVSTKDQIQHRIEDIRDAVKAGSDAFSEEINK